MACEGAHRLQMLNAMHMPGMPRRIPVARPVADPALPMPPDPDYNPQALNEPRLGLGRRLGDGKFVVHSKGCLAHMDAGLSGV
jgi:hypothetical protein